jgi:hypothetical protein
VLVLKIDHPIKDKPTTKFEIFKMEFQKWSSLLQRTGLKPRRFMVEPDAIYFYTPEGWFRLGFNKYTKGEIDWIHSILEYLEERSFKNWAVPWQKTIVWEENDFCYMIQPWVKDGEFFQSSDPASIQRVAEVMADFYRSGKDYIQTKGIEIGRDRWSNIEVEWETDIERLDKLKIDDFPEKARSEVNELRREMSMRLREILSNWRSSGMNCLLEHQKRSGVLGHGNLIVKNILWLGDDYFLLNWEQMAFQPRILDLTTLITDVAYWEPEWILFLINEYSRVQPFWPEEYTGLRILLRHPKNLINTLENIRINGLDRKSLKEAARELARKERCLGKIWRELGTEKRWAGNSLGDNSSLRRLSMTLSPVETWGDFAGSSDSVIKVKNEAKLPADVIEKLTYFDHARAQDRISGGRDGSVLNGSASIILKPEPEPENHTGIGNQMELKMVDSTAPSLKEDHPAVNTGALKIDTVSEINKNLDKIIRWANFPKNSKESERS